MVGWVLFAAWAQAHDKPSQSETACLGISASEWSATSSPHIVVLGERHGVRRDLRKASKIIRRLAREGRVTVALEAVRARHQPALERLSNGEITASQVEGEVEWSKNWGHSFSAYRPVLTVKGVRFVAAGPPLEKKPEHAEIPVPEEYDARLREVALGHGMSEDDVPGFSASMAWRDYRIAELALEHWDGAGFLVLVAGRGHVQGGRGITWQLDQGLSDTPWSSALLARGDQCNGGDRFLQ